jgi:hypothetical protein
MWKGLERTKTTIKRDRADESGFKFNSNKLLIFKNVERA